MLCLIVGLFHMRWREGIHPVTHSPQMMALAPFKPWSMDGWAWFFIRLPICHIHGKEAHRLSRAPITIVHIGWSMFPLEASWNHWRLRSHPSFTRTWSLEAHDVTIYPLTSTWRIGFDGWCGYVGVLNWG
jgi:hypothetical protein